MNSLFIRFGIFVLNLLGVAFLFLIPGMISAKTYIDLAGQHFVAPAVSDEQELPGPSHATWEKVAAPNLAGWEQQAGMPSDVQYWRRIDFSLSAKERSELTDPYFFMGSVIGGESVYLNGVAVSSYAMLDQKRYTWASTNIFVGVRLIKLPSDVLVTGKNTFLVKHGRFYLQNAAIYEGPIGIANYGVAVEQIGVKKTRYDIYAGILLFVDCISVFAFALLAISLPLSRVTFWLSISFLSYGITAIPLSPHIRAFEAGVSDGWEILAVKLNLAVIAAVPQFMAAILNLPIRWPTRVFQCGVLAPVVMSWPFRAEIAVILRDIFDPFWLPSTLGLLLVVAFTSCRSILAGDRRAIPLVGAIATLVAAYIYDLSGEGREFILFFGFELRAFAVRLFPFFFLVAALIDYRMKNAAFVKATENAAHAKESERQRLGQDLHDGIGQMLSSVKMNIQLLRGGTKSDVDQNIDELVTQIDDAIADTRNLSHALTPSLIHSDGLIKAMRKQARFLSRGAAVAVRVDAIPDQDADLPPGLDGELFRIFQEALQNALKHANASTIDVFFRHNNANFTLQISDNGCGFNEYETETSLGLSSLRVRSKAIGAQFSIQSAQGQGTRIIVETQT